ncbi:MAG: hypothetical protein ABSE73_26175 [Planctomycetota bacterium]
MGPVKRAGARTWIEGVPKEEVVEGIWHFDGCPAALRAMLKFKGVADKYLENTVLAAIIGQPFRFWFSPDWASCLAYTFEAPLGVLAAQVLGLDYKWHPGVRDLDAAAAAAAWQGLKAELDAGNPVLLCGGEPVADPKAGPVVVTGYDEAKGLIFFLPPSDWQPPARWSDTNLECRDGLKEQGYRARKRPDETNWVGNGFAPGQGMGGAYASFFAFRERLYTPTDKEVATAVFRHAVALGRGHLQDAQRPWRKPGLEAFDLLAQCLGQEGQEFVWQGKRMPWVKVGETDWWFAMQGLGWPEYRKTAAAFADRCAEDFGSFDDTQKTHIRAAAQAYKESAGHLAALWRLFEAAGPLESEEEHEATVGKALVSRGFRRKAAELVRATRQAEERALNALEQALVPAVAATLPAEQKQRLLQWRNLYGNDLARCAGAAEREPTLYELLAQELALEPLSEAARLTRAATTALEPADLTYLARVGAIVAAIGKPEKCAGGELEMPAPGWRERQIRVRQLAEALQCWLGGMKLELAQLGNADWAAAVGEVYKLLGKLDADKKRLSMLALVTLIRRKPEGWDEAKDGLEALRQDPWWGPFAHRIELLDPPLWSFEHNFKLLLASIGAGRTMGQWHKPGGPLSWSDGNPEDAPKVAAALRALDAWLRNEPCAHEFIAVLGQGEGYKEKRWLVRCLALCLRDHRANYYNWCNQNP